MKFIAHRANMNGPNSYFENNPIQIDICIEKGYDVEVDLRIDQDTGFLWLGHDTPQYIVTWKWVESRCNNLWIHCKDLNTLDKMMGSDFNYFWHQHDDYTLTSKNIIWAYPGKLYSSNTVVVMPEWKNTDWSLLKNIDCYGICSDYVGELNNV